jgi:hypothetical protein
MGRIHGMGWRWEKLDEQMKQQIGGLFHGKAKVEIQFTIIPLFATECEE